MTRERRTDALFLGAGLLALAFLPLLLGGGESATHRPSGPLLVAQPAVIALACVFAVLCAWRFEPGNPVRGSWSLLAAGLFVLTLGEATEAFYVVVRRVDDPFPSLADAFFLLAYPLLMAAFVTFVRAYRESGFPVASGQSRFVAAAVATSAAFGTAVLLPVLGSPAPLVERLISGGYVVFDFVLLIPIFMLMRTTWRFRGGGIWKVWAGVLFGFVFTSVGDLFFAYFQARPGGLFGLRGDQLDAISDLMFLLSYLGIARGTLHQLELLQA
jgi:hypothetical protein